MPCRTTTCSFSSTCNPSRRNSAVQAGETLPEGYELLGVGLVGAVESLLAEWALASPTARSLGEVTEAATLIYLRTLGLSDPAIRHAP